MCVVRGTPRTATLSSRTEKKTGEALFVPLSLLACSSYMHHPDHTVQDSGLEDDVLVKVVVLLKEGPVLHHHHYTHSVFSVK